MKILRCLIRTFSRIRNIFQDKMRIFALQVEKVELFLIILELYDKILHQIIDKTSVQTKTKINKPKLSRPSHYSTGIDREKTHIRVLEIKTVQMNDIILSVK